MYSNAISTLQVCFANEWLIKSIGEDYIFFGVENTRIMDDFSGNENIPGKYIRHCFRLSGVDGELRKSRSRIKPAQVENDVSNYWNLKKDDLDAIKTFNLTHLL